MSDLHDLLDRRAQAVEPGDAAFERVLGRVEGRRRSRRVASSATSMLLLAGVVTAVGLSQTGQAVLPPPPRATATARPTQPAAELPAQAASLRKDLGIQGKTKGAPDAVVVRQAKGEGFTHLSLVHLSTGQAVHLPADATDPLVSPAGGSVVAMSGGQLVVASVTGGAPTVIPSTKGVDAPVSWQAGGSTLITRVHGRWIAIMYPSRSAGGASVRRLSVPHIPGGSTLLSVSPEGDRALLFGLSSSHRAHGPRPHLYVGTFDGRSVTKLHRVPVPEGAIEGPMGWVGSNAFLLAPGPGQAMIVRTNGPAVTVNAAVMGNPCTLGEAPEPCRRAGPDLLGTDSGGSMLFWRVSALPSTGRGDPLVVLYYQTWLDGTHPDRLTGAAARYGPPVASR